MKKDDKLGYSAEEPAMEAASTGCRVKLALQIRKLLRLLVPVAFLSPLMQLKISFAYLMLVTQVLSLLSLPVPLTDLSPLMQQRMRVLVDRRAAGLSTLQTRLKDTK
uniref:Uncharacterized protein n=1 Tax=Globodera pallida TaxID=36090 RepID=A0A183C5F2_GLOPA